jgi:hypothetical protein
MIRETKYLIKKIEINQGDFNLLDLSKMIDLYSYFTLPDLDKHKPSKQVLIMFDGLKNIVLKENQLVDSSS